MFNEVDDKPAKPVQKPKRKIQCTNQIVKAFRDMPLRPGANIMVMGVGGAGRNAIRNMRALGLDQFVELVAIDTDMGCDIQRYGKKRKG